MASSASVASSRTASLFFVGQFVVDGLKPAEELLEVVGAGVVILDKSPEPLGQLQVGSGSF